MKAKQPITSDLDAKEKLIVYVYEYMIHMNAKRSAEIFREEIGYNKDIKVNESPGFLSDWWCVFWDLYCAAPERRHTQAESSNEARAFHDFMRSTPISPSITQTSPPQHPQHPPQFMAGGPRYGPPPGQLRGPPPRMQGPPQHAPHPGGPPGGFMPSGSPRYTQHSAGPPHMNQGPMFGPGPDQMGPSPGLNRMTPVGGPPQQVVGPPPNGPPPQMIGMPGQQMGPGGGQVGPPQPQVNPMQASGPPRNGSQGAAGAGWQMVNSPADQQCFIPGPPVAGNQPSEFSGMMETNNGGQQNQPDEYVMPNAYGQQGDHGDAGPEIMKLKETLENNSREYNENEQSGFNLNFP